MKSLHFHGGKRTTVNADDVWDASEFRIKPEPVVIAPPSFEVFRVKGEAAQSYAARDVIENESRYQSPKYIFVVDDAGTAHEKARRVSLRPQPLLKDRPYRAPNYTASFRKGNGRGETNTDSKEKLMRELGMI